MKIIGKDTQDNIPGNDEATEELVTLPGINIEARDEQALTPLHMACIYGHFSCARCAHVFL